MSGQGAPGPQPSPSFEAGYDRAMYTIGRLVVAMQAGGDTAVVDAICAVVELRLTAGLDGAVSELTGDGHDG